MNQDTKSELKNNLATGASTAAGLAGGVVIGAVVTPNTADAQDMPSPEPTPQPAPAPEPTPMSRPEPQPQSVKQEAATPESPAPEIQKPESDPEPEVEVVGYERITNNDGSQMDIAVINVNGNEFGIMDANLDGEADEIMCDINQNGEIEDDEIEIVHGQGIAMQPFAEAAGFNPLYAQNDMPDYVNDADVDTYMG